MELAINEYLMKCRTSFKALRIDVIEVTEKGIEHIEGVQL
jgi:putative endonuclease